MNFLHSSFELIVIGFNLLPKCWDLLTSFTNANLVDFIGPDDTLLRSVLFYAIYRSLKFCIWIGPYLFYVKQPVQVFFAVVRVSAPAIAEAAIYFGIVGWMARGRRWIKAGALMALSILATFVVRVLLGPLYPPSDRFPEGPLRVRILALLDRTGFNTSNLYFIPGWLNAGTVGIGQMAIIVVGGALLELFSGCDDQVMAVIGHEIGHWHYYHSIVSWLAVSLPFVCAVTIYVVLVSRRRFYQAFDMQTADFIKSNTIPLGVGLILIEIITGQLSVLLEPLQNYIGWMKEYACDSYAVKLGLGHDLYAGMAKLSILHPLAIANFAYGLLHSTHPTLAYRLAAIKRQL
jgi:Zn-dependent protease with chaperone function